MFLVELEAGIKFTGAFIYNIPKVILNVMFELDTQFLQKED